jgi:flagellar hook-length control protein FliK
MANLNALPQVTKATPQIDSSQKLKPTGPKDAHASESKAEPSEFETKLKSEASKKEASKKDDDKDSVAAASQNQAQLLQKALSPVAPAKGEGAEKILEKGADGKKGAALKAVPHGKEELIKNELDGKTADGKVAKTKVELTPAQQAQLAKLQSVEGQKTQAIGQGKGTAHSQSAAQAAALTAAGTQAIDQDFDVESVDVKGGAFATAGLKKGLEESATPKAPISKLSTADYLNLRDVSKKDAISGNPSQAGKPSLDLGTFGKTDPKKARLTAGEGRETLGSAALSQNFQLNSHSKVIDAHVTQGSAGKAVLSHDALHQMTQQVNLLSQAKQDGEIKIRLRPDHLGELQMSVKTQGQNVAIDIKAHSVEAKKIIEESLGSLRASLSEQNLNLSRVDVVTSTNQAQAGDQGLQMDLSNQRQSSGQENASRFSDQQSNARQERLYQESQAPRNLDIARANRVNRSGADGLDMIA